MPEVEPALPVEEVADLDETQHVVGAGKAPLHDVGECENAQQTDPERPDQKHPEHRVPVGTQAPVIPHRTVVRPNTIVLRKR